MVAHKKQHQQYKKKQTNKISQAARYTGIAFEMFFVILAGVFGGIKLDERLDTSPIFTAIFALIAVLAAIYLVIKDLIRKK